MSGFQCENREEVLFYDGLRLLEIYELSPTPQWRARYYYADEGEVPIAADLIDQHPAPNQPAALIRYYLMTDRQGSVIGLVDEQGTVVERVSYDPWARPTVRTLDAQRPVITSIEVASSGEMSVRFSEPILTRPIRLSSGGTYPSGHRYLGVRNA